MSEEYADKVFPMLRPAGVTYYSKRNTMRYKPLLGGIWGTGRYQVASLLVVTPTEYVVYYAVQEIDSGMVLSFSDTKSETLGLGRRVLEEVSPARLRQERELHAIACRKHDDACDQAHREYVAELAARAEASAPKVKSIPKRRQQIFDACDGKCHYCGTALTLDGKWHIEHKMPRALMGTNEPSNLVASCVPCNMKKRDKTDLEFQAQRAKEAT